MKYIGCEFKFDFFWKNVFVLKEKCRRIPATVVFNGVGLPLMYFNPNTMSNPEAGEETEPAAAEFIKGTTKNNYRIAESVVKRWMQLQLKSWDWFIPSFQQLVPLIYGLVGNISGNFHTTGILEVFQRSADHGALWIFKSWQSGQWWWIFWWSVNRTSYGARWGWKNLSGVPSGIESPQPCCVCTSTTKGDLCTLRCNSARTCGKSLLQNFEAGFLLRHFKMLFDIVEHTPTWASTSRIGSSPI